MKRGQFIENLQLYGSDIEKWPERLRQEALSLYQGSSEFKDLVESEKGFESMLMGRAIDKPSSDFERRITLSAKPKTELDEKNVCV